MKALLEKHREFITYALSGVGTVAVDMGLYILTVEVQGIRMANFWGWLGAMLFAFLTNKYWVFCTGAQGIRAFSRELGEFAAVRLVTLLVQVEGADLLVRHGVDQTLFGVAGGVAKVLVTVLVILINYLMSKFLVFRLREARS